MKINNIASDRDLAKMIVGLTDKMDLDAIICLTEKGGLAGELQELDPERKNYCSHRRLPDL